MGFARTLETENEMRALMNVQTLNEMLSVYCGMEGTRNCLLICHQVSAAAPGQGPDRSRLFHRKQVAVAFRYQRGQWWFGDAAKPCWYPTLGEHGDVPPLEYMDVGSLYVPVEMDWRPASPNFASWAMMPQTEQKTPEELKEKLNTDLLIPESSYAHMLLLAWYKFKNASKEDIAKLAVKQRVIDSREFYEWLAAQCLSRHYTSHRRDRFG